MAIKESNHRVTVTVKEDEFQQMKYWSAKHDCSINDYLREAILSAIKRENNDYDLPTLEQQRLNQIVDRMDVMSANVQSLEQVTISGFDSLLGLCKGDNYLLEHEDGEI